MPVPQLKVGFAALSYFTAAGSMAIACANGLSTECGFSLGLSTLGPIGTIGSRMGIFMFKALPAIGSFVGILHDVENLP